MAICRCVDTQYQLIYWQRQITKNFHHFCMKCHVFVQNLEVFWSVICFYAHALVIIVFWTNFANFCEKWGNIFITWHMFFKCDKKICMILQKKVVKPIYRLVPICGCFLYCRFQCATQQTQFRFQYVNFFQNRFWSLPSHHQ